MKSIITKANTPAKRIGLLCAPLSIILTIGGAVHWSIFNTRWKYSLADYFSCEVFDIKYGHYVLINLVALSVLIVGVFLYFGAAEKVTRWIKTGNISSKKR